MSKLQLKRPIVFFDLETTGLDVVKDRIVEIALLKVHPDGTEETLHTLVNPGMPIPKTCTASVMLMWLINRLLKRWANE